MDKYDYVRLAEREEWGVLMRHDAPLAAQPVVTAADLAALPLILPRRTSVQSELAWKRRQPFSPAATQFIAFAKCFLGMA